MLKTPELGPGNPILSLIGHGAEPVVLEPGVILIDHWSLDLLIWGRNAPEMYMGYPWFGEGVDDLWCYGVCDSPEQFLNRYRDKLRQDPRTFCIGFTHVAKDPSNKGKGGGWRWHKWGPYIGDGEPTTEYLDDEEGFAQGVFTYHIYQTDGPKIEDPVLVRIREAREREEAKT